MAIILPVKGDTSWDVKLNNALTSMQASIDAQTATLVSIQASLTALNISVAALQVTAGAAVWQA